jgi:60S ribosomal subunit assembly/export protein LOC1
MAAEGNATPSKGSKKRSTKSTRLSTKSRPKKPNSRKGPPPKPTEQKSKSATTNLKKRKPPHLRYTEAQLKVPQLNGIRPTGVQKPPNKKKGKQFVDDGAGMKTILAMVMAEKEGNIESKMIRARQMEELREARRAEAEKRAEGKKAGLEERKDEIRQGKKKRRRTDGGAVSVKSSGLESGLQKPKKKVSFR